MDFQKLLAALVQLRTDFAAKKWMPTAADANMIVGLILAAFLVTPLAAHEHAEVHAAMHAAGPLTVESATAAIDAHIAEGQATGKINLKGLLALLLQFLPLIFAQPAP